MKATPIASMILAIISAGLWSEYMRITDTFDIIGICFLFLSFWLGYFGLITFGVKIKLRDDELHWRGALVFMVVLLPFMLNLVISQEKTDAITPYTQQQIISVTNLKEQIEKQSGESLYRLNFEGTEFIVYRQNIRQIETSAQNMLNAEEKVHPEFLKVLEALLSLSTHNLKK